MRLVCLFVLSSRILATLTRKSAISFSLSVSSDRSANSTALAYDSRAANFSFAFKSSARISSMTALATACEDSACSSRSFNLLRVDCNFVRAESSSALFDASSSFIRSKSSFNIGSNTVSESKFSRCLIVAFNSLTVFLKEAAESASAENATNCCWSPAMDSEDI